MTNGRLFRVDHEEPNDFRCDYILLPYGEYYEKTARILSAKPGDTMRFHQGRDAEIMAVRVVDDEVLCNMLCRMRYGIPWAAAYDRWVKYAMFDGHGRDIILRNKCILVTFTYKCKESRK